MPTQTRLLRLVNSLQLEQYAALLVLFLLLTLTAGVGVATTASLHQPDLATNLTLRQESRLYQLSALVIRYNATTSGPEQQSIVQSAAAVIQDFANAQTTFRTGDKSTGLRALQDASVLTALYDFDQQWADCRSALERYFSLTSASDAITFDSSNSALDGALKAAHNFEQALTNQAAVKGVDLNGPLGILTTVFAIVPILITVRAVRSIGRLRKTTEALGAGNLEVRASERTLTELADLGHTFNTMAGAIQRRETELRQINATLEKRVEERTHELEAAKKVAEDSARIKSEFLSNMSHELRTPLSAITGYSSIMLQGMSGEIDGEAREMLQRVYSNGQHLIALINQILDLAKLEAGRMEILSQPLSPRELAKEWATRVKVLADTKQLVLGVNVAPELPETIYGDSSRLTQIALNLLSNAIKFTEAGSVNLTVKRQTDTWTIEVSDTGVGIPPHALNYIFEEFRQVDGSYSRSQGGTGLGLAIARNLCRLMDGNIQVTSELGKGSTFTVTLPLVETAKQPADNLQAVKL